MGEIFIDSASLRDINRFLELYPDLQRVVGMPAQFRVVLDANIAVADLLHKLERPSVRNTAIEECAAAGVLEVHAPRWLDEEMTTRTIPKAARQNKLAPEPLHALWMEYREMLIWDETLRRPEDTTPDCVDVDDMPYVSLEEKIGAVGILSRDKHIAAMGGTPLTLEFVLTVRRYARAASVHLSIYVNGSLIGAFGYAAIMGIVRKAKEMFMGLPPIVRALLVVGLAVAIVHPSSRRWILDKLSAVGELGSAVFPELLSLAERATATQEEAASELETINLLIAEKNIERASR